MSKKGELDSAYERIYLFLKGEIPEDELSNSHKHILNRWQSAFTILRNYESVSDAIPKLMHQFKLSHNRARVDCIYAQKLFGNVHASNKEGLRHLLTEWTKDVIIMARGKNPPDLKEINNAIRNLAAINGLDREDPDKIDFSKLEKHENPINVPKEIMDLLMILASKGSLDLTTIRRSIDNTVDITHEVIKE